MIWGRTNQVATTAMPPSAHANYYVRKGTLEKGPNQRQRRLERQRAKADQARQRRKRTARSLAGRLVQLVARGPDKGPIRVLANLAAGLRRERTPERVGNRSGEGAGSRARAGEQAEARQPQPELTGPGMSPSLEAASERLSGEPRVTPTGGGSSAVERAAPAANGSPANDRRETDGSQPPPAAKAKKRKARGPSPTVEVQLPEETAAVVPETTTRRRRRIASFNDSATEAAWRRWRKQGRPHPRLLPESVARKLDALNANGLRSPANPAGVTFRKLSKPVDKLEFYTRVDRQIRILFRLGRHNVLRDVRVSFKHFDDV
jgi:hypothetical protein